jgi:hypothetical protein
LWRMRVHGWFGVGVVLLDFWCWWCVWGMVGWNGVEGAGGDWVDGSCSMYDNHMISEL